MVYLETITGPLPQDENNPASHGICLCDTENSPNPNENFLTLFSSSDSTPVLVGLYFCDSQIPISVIHKFTRSITRLIDIS